MSFALVRSPQYINTLAAAGTLSHSLEISVGGTLRYTLLKNTTVATYVVWEWAELVRDYFTPTFTGTYPVDLIQVSLVMKSFTGLNGTGTATTISTTPYDAMDGYGTFMQGVNPQNTITDGWLVCAKFPNNSGLGTAGKSVIFIPIGVAGKVPSISGGSIRYQDYNTTDTTLNLTGGAEEGQLIIERIDCTKYGTGNKFTFLNKLGFLQDLYFFLKQVKKLNTTREHFQNNTLKIGQASVTYDTRQATKQSFNTEGTQSNTFSSGYYPEYANCYFEEMLLSTSIWMTRPSTTGSGNEIVPVMIKTSGMTYKTSLNDKLVEYTMEFEDAFDYINNVR